MPQLAQRPPPRPGDKGDGPRRPRYITPEGFARMKAELDDLWRNQRPRIIDEVAAAAAQGDRSENAEYTYGKKKLREIDRRIRFLGERLEILTVVNPKDQKDQSRIYFGAWFTAESDDGKRITYRIVGPDEFEPSQGTISIDSPLAKAVMGKSVGDCATVKRPMGDLDVEIIRIWYAPEAGASGKNEAR